VRPQRIIVIGASGGVGSSVVQLARYYGGPELQITGVASARNEEYCRSIGVDEFIEYHKHPKLSLVIPKASIDLVADTVSGNEGVPNYVDDTIKLLTPPQGKYVCTNSMKLGDYIRKFLLVQQKNFDLFMMNPINAANRDLPEIARLVADGKYKLPVDKEYQFNEESMFDALSDMEKRHTRGKLKISIS
jgi:NADPH:quinone reductase-like Zn-dependent oxidoreductase